MIDSPLLICLTELFSCSSSLVSKPFIIIIIVIRAEGRRKFPAFRSIRKIQSGDEANAVLNIEIVILCTDVDLPCI